MKDIKVSVTLSGEDESFKFSFTFLRDYTQYAKTLIECNNIFTNTGEKMTEENIDRYFSEGTFTDDELEGLNGSHFIYGFIESLAQSDECPDVLRLFDGQLNIKVERCL